MTPTQTTATSLKVSRVIKAPRAKVYNAFLDKTLLNQWYHPGPMTTKVHKIEPKVGGSFRIDMTAPPGAEGKMGGTHTAIGKFLELKPNERIVHTFAWESADDTMQGEGKLTITLKDVTGGTEVTLLHEGLRGKESVDSHTEGWIGCLENLAGVF